MTRLAQVKAELAKVTAESWANHMVLLLSQTEKPGHVERFKTDDGFRYVISAFGLTRADGGYLMIRSICEGQRDSIRAYRLLDWANQPRDCYVLVEFAIAAERINLAQRRALGL